MAASIPRFLTLAGGVAGLALTLAVPAWADTYAYDALGRLVGVVFSDGSTITYTYDSAGNRTAVVQTTP